MCKQSRNEQHFYFKFTYRTYNLDWTNTSKVSKVSQWFKCITHLNNHSNKKKNNFIIILFICWRSLTPCHVTQLNQLLFTDCDLMCTNYDLSLIGLSCDKWVVGVCGWVVVISNPACVSWCHAAINIWPRRSAHEANQSLSLLSSFARFVFQVNIEILKEKNWALTLNLSQWRRAAICRRLTWPVWLVIFSIRFRFLFRPQ